MISHPTDVSSHLSLPSSSRCVLTPSCCSLSAAAAIFAPRPPPSIPLASHHTRPPRQLREAAGCSHRHQGQRARQDWPWHCCQEFAAHASRHWRPPRQGRRWIHPGPLEAPRRPQPQPPSTDVSQPLQPEGAPSIGPPHWPHAPYSWPECSLYDAQRRRRAHSRPYLGS